jgi:hypothetical protein
MKSFALINAVLAAGLLWAAARGIAKAESPVSVYSSISTCAAAVFVLIAFVALALADS